MTSSFFYSLLGAPFAHLLWAALLRPGKPSALPSQRPRRQWSQSAQWLYRFRYDASTWLIAVLAASALAPYPHQAFAWPEAAGIWALAAAGGGALPFMIATIRHRSRTASTRHFPSWDDLALVATATAEEVIWRWASMVALSGLGFPIVLAWIVSGLGFLSLHVIIFGPRVLPYLSFFTLLVSSAVIAGGWPAGAFLHTAHNLTIAYTVSKPRPIRARSGVKPPVSKPW